MNRIIAPPKNRTIDLDDFKGTPSNGQVYTYDGGDSKWYGASPPAALAATGSGAPVTSPADGSFYLDTTNNRLLAYVSGAWSRTSAGVSYASGVYYPGVDCTASGSSADSAQNRIRALPAIVFEKVTLSHLAINVATVGESGCKVRLGIYADGGAGLPGSLLIDAGQADGDSTGLKDVACSITLLPGCYWLASVSQLCSTTRPTLTSYSGLITARFGHNSGTFNNSTYLADGVSGSLPGTFPSITRGNSSTPAVLLKVA